jgi:4-amino-4-deoxy-L-arabinose transferase-like glycosyltransferase
VASPLLYVTSGFWVAGQHDMSAAQFLVVALWFHVRGYETKKLRWQWGTGLLLGIAMLNKPTVGAMLPLMSLQALLLATPWLRVAAHTAAASVALLAAVAVGFASVLLLGTKLDDLIEVPYLFSVSTQYIHDPIAASRSLPGVLLNTLGRSWAHVLVASLPAVVWLFRPANRSIASTALPILWLTGVISYFVQSRALGYHLAPSFLATVGLSCISAAVLWRGELFVVRSAFNRIALAGLAVFVLVAGGYRFAVFYGALPGAMLARDSSRYLAQFDGNDNISVDDAVKFAARARQGAQSDCLLLIGDGSAINYLSRLRQPTGFYYFPVIAQVAPPLPMAAKWQARWAADLKASDCRFALIGRRVRDEWMARPSPMADALHAFLLDYRETGTVGKTGGLLTFERK